MRVLLRRVWYLLRRRRLLGALALLGAVAAFAAWLPARRAARIDPAVVLRCE